MRFPYPPEGHELLWVFPDIAGPGQRVPEHLQVLHAAMAEAGGPLVTCGPSTICSRFSSSAAYAHDQEKITLVVINLDQFDFIVWLPDIMGFLMELRGDPMRIHILGTRRRTLAPTVIDTWEDENGQLWVHVLDETATSLRHWQSQGRSELYHLFEDPWSSLRAGGSSDPIEEIERRACLMGLQAEAKALGLDARALEKEEDRDAISRRN